MYLLDFLSFETMDEISDLDLISKALLGEREAFAPLVERYHSRIILFCKEYLKDQARSEDAAQEVFLRAFSRLSKFRGDASFRSWLYKIARNYCIDQIRSANRKGEIVTDELDTLDVDSVSAEIPFARAMSRDLLSKILQSIQPHHREILLLRELYDLPYDEIGDVLGITQDAVKGRLKRARLEVQQVFRHLESDRDVYEGKRE